MGVFNGDSVYNSGNGGGSLKNVGTLTDADFIHVDNNTISDYTNETRRDIYFYFDKKDFPLNAVISVNTDVNATVHVYTYDDFLFVPLGLIGSNSIVGGNDYNVIVTVDSFAVEEVTSIGYEEFIDVAGERLGVVKIGDRLWTNKNLQVKLNYSKYGPTGTPDPQNTYPGYFYGLDVSKINLFNSEYLKNGWRIAENTDYQNLESAISGDYDSLISVGQTETATNSTGFSMCFTGDYNFKQGVSLQGFMTGFLSKRNNDRYLIQYTKGGSQFSYTYNLSPSSGGNLRFCREI